MRCVCVCGGVMEKEWKNEMGEGVMEKGWKNEVGWWWRKGGRMRWGGGMEKGWKNEVGGGGNGERVEE